MTELHDPQVIANISKDKKAYDEIRAEMEDAHWGKTVVMHNGDVVAIYNDRGDAYNIAREKFGLGNFSLHLVGQQPINLGFHAVPLTSRE